MSPVPQSSPESTPESSPPNTDGPASVWISNGSICLNFTLCGADCVHGPVTCALVRLRCLCGQDERGDVIVRGEGGEHDGSFKFAQVTGSCRREECVTSN